MGSKSSYLINDVVKQRTAGRQAVLPQPRDTDPNSRWTDWCCCATVHACMHASPAWRLPDGIPAQQQDTFRMIVFFFSADNNRTIRNVFSKNSNVPTSNSSNFANPLKKTKTTGGGWTQDAEHCPTTILPLLLLLLLLRKLIAHAEEQTVQSAQPPPYATITQRSPSNDSPLHPTRGPSRSQASSSS